MKKRRARVKPAKRSEHGRAAKLGRRAARHMRAAARLARRVRRWWRPAPRPAKILMGVLVILVVWLLCNWIYQVVRKPSELFFPVSGTLNKSPAETWRQYAPIFKKFATNVMTPDLLAAIAQVEGSGNPVARTYWRWSAGWMTLRPRSPREQSKPAGNATRWPLICGPRLTGLST